MPGTRNILVVAEIAVIDDSGVERFCVIAYNFICLLRDHTGGLSILRVDYADVRVVSE